MSLEPRTAFEIPEETQRVARAAFPQGTLCLRIADALGPVYGDEQFADLFPRRGQPAEAPTRTKLANSCLATHLGHLTRFSVPLRLKIAACCC